MSTRDTQTTTTTLSRSLVDSDGYRSTSLTAGSHHRTSDTLVTEESIPTIQLHKPEQSTIIGSHIHTFQQSCFSETLQLKEPYEDHYDNEDQRQSPTVTDPLHTQPSSGFPDSSYSYISSSILNPSPEVAEHNNNNSTGDNEQSQLGTQTPNPDSSQVTPTNLDLTVYRGDNNIFCACSPENSVVDNDRDTNIFCTSIHENLVRDRDGSGNNDILCFSHLNNNSSLLAPLHSTQRS